MNRQSFFRGSTACQTIYMNFSESAMNITGSATIDILTGIEAICELLLLLNSSEAVVQNNPHFGKCLKLVGTVGGINGIPKTLK